MNNEPVAYINIEERKLEWAKPTTWYTPTIAQMAKIPLYTHPADRIAELEQALENIIAISDRKHDAWDKAKELLKKASEK